MAVVVESSQTGSASSTSTLTIAKPAELAVDDLLVAVVYQHKDSSSTTFNTPSGWSLAGNEIDSPGGAGSDTHGYAIFYKLATSGDVAASNFSFTTGVSTDFLNGVLLRVSGIRTDSQFGAYDDETLTDEDNPSYTVSLSPAQNNVLYVAVFMSDKYTATDVTLNGTNPTWTRYLNASNTIDGTFFIQAFAAPDASPESSITTLTPTETGSDSGTDSVGALAFFLGQNDASATLTLTTTTNTKFDPAGSAGASLTLNLTETTNTKFDPVGESSSPTNWTNEADTSTTWTNEEKL